MLFCIKDKEEKCQSIIGKNDQLWLILVDYIHSKVNEYIIQDFERFEPIKTKFDKVIIISKRNSKWNVELPVIKN